MHILIPAIEVTSQAYSITLLPKAWRDRIGITSLLVCGYSRAVLVPAIWLAGTVAITRKNLEHDIRADSICPLPTVCHATRITAIGIDKDHKPAIDAQEARITAVL